MHGSRSGKGANGLRGGVLLSICPWYNFKFGIAEILGVHRI